MFNPKVSIIIPVYNWANYIAEAINGALNQTYKNIEVLVINDGSTDNWATEKVAKSFGDKIKYIKKENWGVSTALNIGIKEMSWEYFSWLSHDDLYYPTKIEEQIKELETIENKNTILSCNFEFINENWEKIWWSNINTSDYDNILYSIFTRKYSVYWCALLIPKKILDEVWYFDTEMKCTQDYDYWLRILEKWYEFKYTDKVLTKYRKHSEQWTNDSWLIFNKCLKEENDLYLNYLNKFWYKKILEKTNINKLVWIKNILVPIIKTLILITFKKVWLYKVFMRFYKK